MYTLFEYFNRDKDLNHINRDCFLFIASLKKENNTHKIFKSNKTKQGIPSEKN